jgi:hypothetical protein
MRAVRLLVAGLAVVSILGWRHTAAASSASSPLGVSVKVVKSCAVHSRAVDADTADVRLSCSRGHSSNVLVGSDQLAPPRGLVRIDDTDDASPDAETVRVVTVNF